MIQNSKVVSTYCAGLYLGLGGLALLSRTRSATSAPLYRRKHVNVLQSQSVKSKVEVLICTVVLYPSCSVFEFQLVGERGAQRLLMETDPPSSFMGKVAERSDCHV